MTYFEHTASDMAAAAASARAEDLAAVDELVASENADYRRLLLQAGHPSMTEHARHTDRLVMLHQVRRTLADLGVPAGA